MKKKILFWTPRILVILYILFLSMFALDVFNERYPIPELFLALFMHLIPSLILIIILIIAWKWEKIGGYIFILAGIISVFFFKTYEDIISFLIVSLPILIIGILFILNKSKK